MPVSIALSSVAAFALAVSVAQRVDLASYTLRSGSVRDALVAAARGGAAVRVRLAGDPLDDAAATLRRANADTVAVLSAAGADAALTAPPSSVLHLKAAVVDGVAWFDDRNWPDDGPQTVVRDTDPDDVHALTSALSGGNGSDDHLETTKAGAQALELDVIRTAGAVPLAVESESFGSGAVYAALLARARAGEPTRLLVAGREAAAVGPAGDTERRRLGKLSALGTEVRTGDPHGADLDEKLAVTSDAGWMGSANATYARGAAGAQRDWGMATRQPQIVAALEAAFDANWRAARLFTP